MCVCVRARVCMCTQRVFLKSISSLASLLSLLSTLVWQTVCLPHAKHSTKDSKLVTWSKTHFTDICYHKNLSYSAFPRNNGLENPEEFILMDESEQAVIFRLYNGLQKYSHHNLFYILTNRNKHIIVKSKIIYTCLPSFSQIKI